MVLKHALKQAGTPGFRRRLSHAKVRFKMLWAAMVALLLIQVAQGACIARPPDTLKLWATAQDQTIKWQVR